MSPTSKNLPPCDRPAASPEAEGLEAWAGRRVAVALSGGVDSAVAAHGLVAAGADVIGLSLRLHDPDPDNPLAPRACCPPDDLQDARRIAEGLDIPFYVLDGRRAFDEAVVRPFVRAYVSGRTPNPCVGCNAFVKLEQLHRRAKALGCEALATGHYARKKDGRLLQAVDGKKDQSYFLFSVGPQILADLIFPLGSMRKEEVREAAVQTGLPVAHKLESQEVCFVGGAGAGGFVKRQPEAQGDHAGAIVDERGRELGRHAGIMNFTVGQRRGIGIAAESPLHVLRILPETKQVVVGPAQSLAAHWLRAERVTWTRSVAPVEPFEALVQIRYRDPGTPATVHPMPEGAEVRFGQAVRAVAPGQATVFRVGEEVVGGGWIAEGGT
ncbi:MAG: tRNA 2-thiouridine(34) synthase MnmA [Myxococcota bacterium]